MPIIRDSANAGFIPYVKGIRSAIPIVAVSPGKAPIIIPRNTPIKSAKMLPLEIRFAKPLKRY
jgi:hypothetical protein